MFELALPAFCVLFSAVAVVFSVKTISETINSRHRQEAEVSEAKNAQKIISFRVGAIDLVVASHCQAKMDSLPFNREGGIEMGRLFEYIIAIANSSQEIGEGKLAVRGNQFAFLVGLDFVNDRTRVVVEDIVSASANSLLEGRKILEFVMPKKADRSETMGL